MSKLINAVEQRLHELEHPEEPEVVEDTNKVFSIRLPIEVIEKLDVIGTILQLSKTEVARMMITNGIDEVIEEFKITHESHGMPFEDLYAVETGEMTMEEAFEKHSKKEGANK